MRQKRGQQEIVGFVLIVVMVVVGLMIFLLYSLKDDRSSEDNDLGIENLMASITRFTTSCIINQERQSISDMFVNCYEGNNCNNNPDNPCDILNNYLEDMLEAAYKTEGNLDGMIMDFYTENNGVISQIPDFYTVSFGNCTYANYRGFEKSMPMNNSYVSLKVC